MKRIFRFPGISFILATMMLFVSAGALAQTAKQPRPTPTPRRPLPKPVAGSRGFERFAPRDASVRLIAGAATREPLDPARAAYERGDADYSAGKYKDAVKEFSVATGLKPKWISAHYALALSLVEIGDRRRAIDEFNQVIKLNAGENLKVASYYNMGNAYADLGDYEKAIEAYRLAIKLNSTLSKPHHNLGLAYAAVNRLEEAVAEFKQAVQLRPDYPEAHFNLGVAYVQLGKKPEAEEQQRILAKLKPELAAKLDALIKK